MIWYFSWSSHCFGSERDISITIGWMHSWSTETESYWVCWFSYFSANITHTWTTKSVNNQNNLFAISPTSWLILLELVDCLPLFCVLFLLASIFCGNLRHTFLLWIDTRLTGKPRSWGFFCSVNHLGLVKHEVDFIFAFVNELKSMGLSWKRGFLCACVWIYE